MRSSTIIAIFIIALILPPMATAQDYSRLLILTEEYPPYNYIENGKVCGTSTEIVVQLLDRLDTGLTRKDIRLVPWARAYKEVITSKDTILFSMARTKERENQFKLVGPIGYNTTGIIARRVDRVVIKNPEDFERYRIGVVRDDIGHQLMRKLIPEKDLDITSSSENNLRKLKEGRVDLFAYDTEVVNFMLVRLGLDPEEFETVYVLNKSEYCIAFNKHADDAIVQSFQAALNLLLQERPSRDCP